MQIVDSRYLIIWGCIKELKDHKRLLAALKYGSSTEARERVLRKGQIWSSQGPRAIFNTVAKRKYTTVPGGYRYPVRYLKCHKYQCHHSWSSLHYQPFFNCETLLTSEKKQVLRLPAWFQEKTSLCRYKYRHVKCGCCNTAPRILRGPNRQQ